MKNILVILGFFLIAFRMYSAEHQTHLNKSASFGLESHFKSKNDTVISDNYNLVWADEFSGNTIDTNNWIFQTGQHGWGNHEWQNYTKEGNASVSDGTIKIIAKLVGEGQKVGDYTSSRLNSTKSFTYGKFEIRAKLPLNNGNGLWPAIWMLGNDSKELGWPACGEIDIMENVSYAPDTVYFTIHSLANNHRDGTQVSSGGVLLATSDEEFHTYGLIWTETYLEFYIDNEENIKLRFNRLEKFNQENWPFNKPFYFILNLAVGGDWGGSHGVDDSIFPATMEIDYVRVYEKSKK